MNIELPSLNKSCQPYFSDPELSDSSSLSTSGSGSPVGIQLGLDIADETLDGDEAVGSDQDYYDNIAPLDISEDPLFQQSDAIFKWLEGQKSQPDALGELETLPSAFRESPPIRNAYIRAFIMSSYHGATHAAVSEFLQGQRALFQSIKEYSGGGLFHDLDTMAITLPTVEKRLGLSCDPYISYYFLCSACWRPHHSSEFPSLESPECPHATCSGLLYTIKPAENGMERRIPIKFLPCINLDAVLQRILLCPGKFDQMQHWRHQGDEPGIVPPISEAEHYSCHPVDEKMHDIHDGWGWQAIEAGLRRVRAHPPDPAPPGPT
ncbi:uncharacterized protein EI90DRAFT_3157328 [Cantharellus anzutake]|uniref:uncharacterized protein n=1 Tax=Cantharellus anzutake TaxID=1750568 RepID=UPI00190428DB|nr:uncharacterized protein EI90DRAFT_3157328 [Cantharellus anzutake]KAF8324606.1 hypothetical protein EI90DRAFT_3157328 [Cantharellus anzutake]